MAIETSKSYEVEIEIKLPRERVIELFLDPNNLAKWQPDLINFEQISGESRQVGSQSKQIHKMGGREIEMIETIKTHNYPNEFSATYEADGIWNLIENHFFKVDNNKTRWVLNAEYKCSGIVVKLMSIFMPSVFKKQTLTFMNRFREFAERSTA